MQQEAGELTASADIRIEAGEEQSVLLTTSLDEGKILHGPLMQQEASQLTVSRAVQLEAGEKNSLCF